MKWWKEEGGRGDRGGEKQGGGVQRTMRESHRDSAGFITFANRKRCVFDGFLMEALYSIAWSLKNNLPESLFEALKGLTQEARSSNGHGRAMLALLSGYDST